MRKVWGVVLCCVLIAHMGLVFGRQSEWVGMQFIRFVGYGDRNLESLFPELFQIASIEDALVSDCVEKHFGGDHQKPIFVGQPQIGSWEHLPFLFFLFFLNCYILPVSKWVWGIGALKMQQDWVFWCSSIL